MKTSLTELEQIERWLLEEGDVRDRLVIEARIISNWEMQENAHWQKTVYELVQLYGRQKIRDEIKAIESTLFHNPKYQLFQKRIQSIFKQ